VPGFWGLQGVTEPPSTHGFGYDGAAWYRRRVTIPAGWKASPQPLKLVIGGLADTGEVYWNGRLVTRAQGHSYVRETLTIPIEDALIPYGGEATIAVKIANTGPAGGLVGPVHIEKNADWLTPRTELRYGERFPDFRPDAYRSW
jgi:hypothetical protein